jgi:hypothetical protein
MQVSTIRIDLAKNVFQVHGLDAHGKVVLVRQLRRAPRERWKEAATPGSPKSPQHKSLHGK